MALRVVRVSVAAILYGNPISCIFWKLLSKNAQNPCFGASYKLTWTTAMIWYGRYNAILVLFLIGGCVLAFLLDNAGIAVATFFLVVIIRICTAFINTIFKAFFGRPLVYDTKIMVQKDGAAAS